MQTLPPDRKIRALIVTGKDSFHHRWRASTNRLREILEGKPYFEVFVTEAFNGATRRTLDSFDVVILNYFGARRPGDEEHRWGADTEAALFDFVREGGGLVVSHSSVAMGETWTSDGDELLHLFGGGLRKGARRAPGDGVDVEVTQPDHPITRGLRTRFHSPIDDKFVNLAFAPDGDIDVLAETFDAAEDYLNGAYYAVAGAMPGTKIYDIEEAKKLPGVNKRHPIAWTRAYGKGRVFVLSIGHVGAATIQDAHQGLREGRDVGQTIDVSTQMPQFKTLLTRGVEWAATGKVFDQPLAPLATV